MDIFQNNFDNNAYNVSVGYYGGWGVFRLQKYFMKDL